MTMKTIEIPKAKLEALCRKWRIKRLELFGSVLRGQAKPGSDIDLLVEFEPDERWSLMDLARAELEFASLFGRQVDLVDKNSLRRSANWIRRHAILESAEVIYAA